MNAHRLTPWVALSLLAGCQVVAGLTSLDTEAGAGGTTSTGGQGGAVTSGGAGGVGGEGDGGDGDGGGGGEDPCDALDCGPYLCDGGCLQPCDDDEDCVDGSDGGRAAVCEMPPATGGMINNRCVYCGDDAGQGNEMGCPTVGDDCAPVTGMTGQCRDMPSLLCRYTCDNCSTVAPIVVEAQRRPSVIRCDGPGCDGVTFECRGPFGCTLRCAGTNSCDGTTLVCNQWSTCHVVCEGATGCLGMGVTQVCGDNVCSAECPMAVARVIQQNCGPDRRCDCDAEPNCAP